MNKAILRSILLIGSFGLLSACSQSESTSKEVLFIEAKSFNDVYDGQEKEISGFENESSKGIKAKDEEGNTYYISGLTSNASGTNVRDSLKSIPIEGTPTIVDAEGRDVTIQFTLDIKPGSFTIEKADLTIRSDDVSKEYDGLPLVNGEIEMVEQTGWIGSDGATFEFFSEQLIPGSSKNEFKVIPNNGTDLENYNINSEAGELTVTSREEKYHVKVNGKSYEDCYTSDLHAVEGFVNEVEEGIEICNNDLIYYIQGLSSKAEGTFTTDSKEIPIEGEAIVLDEYGNDVTSEFNVEIIPGQFTIQKANISIKSKDYTCTYNGEEQSVSGFESDTEKGTEFTYNDDTYYITGLTSEAKGKNVKDSKETVISGQAVIVDEEGNDVTTEFNVDVIKGLLTINKANVTLKSADVSKEYDGKDLKNEKAKLATEVGFVDGEGATYSFSKAQKLVGKVENEFTYKLKDGTSADNYDISVSFGDLIVKDRKEKMELKIEGNDFLYTYDGRKQSVSGFKGEDKKKGVKVKSGDLVYYVSGLKSYAEGTKPKDSCKTKISGVAVVKDADGNDVSSQMHVTAVPGDFTIKKRKVTLLSASASKTDDGHVLYSKKLQKEKGWVNGDGATYYDFSELQDVGSCKNKFEYELNKGTDPDCYEIEKKYGKLTIKAAPPVHYDPTVYVSRQGVIHSNSSCSRMKYYTPMPLSQAQASGYRHCQKCY